MSGVLRLQCPACWQVTSEVTSFDTATLTEICGSCSWKTEPLWRLEVEYMPTNEHDPAHTTSHYYGHRNAYLMGRQLACCRGVLNVQVFAPDNSIAHEWSSKNNRWHAHVEVPI